MEGRLKKNGAAPSLRVHLLGQHVPAEGNSAVEGDCRKIRALRALEFGPGLDRRHYASERGAKKTDEAVVRADGLHAAAFFRTLWAEVQELNNTREVVPACALGEPGDVLHFGRQSLFGRCGDQRTAIGREKLQQGSQGEQQYGGGHHRGTKASLGTMRASSGTRQNA